VVLPSFATSPDQRTTPVTGGTITIAANSIATSGAHADGHDGQRHDGVGEDTTNTVTVNRADSIVIFAEDKNVTADTGSTSLGPRAAIRAAGL